VKSVEEYAIELVVEGAQHVAEDDTNESGEIGDGDHEDACDLALDMAKAIRDNPRAFAEWCEGMGVRWNRHEEG
jgi:hypothetical protein